MDEIACRGASSSRQVFGTSEWAFESAQLFDVSPDALQYLCPILAPRLAVKAHRRVPGCIRAIQHPAPVGREWQHRPDRPAQGSGEVRHRGVDRYQQIQVEENG